MDKKELEIDLLDLAKNIWSERKKIIRWGIMGLVVGVVIALSIPERYAVTASVVPENIAPTKGGNFAGLAALAGLSSQDKIDGVSYLIYPQIITLTPFVMELANIEVVSDGKKMTFLDYTVNHQSYPWWNHIIGAPFKLLAWGMSLLFVEQPEVDQRIIDVQQLTKPQLDFRESIEKSLTVEYDSESGILSIKLSTQNPVISRQITDSILVNLQNYMTKYKTSKSLNEYKNTSKIFKDTQFVFYKTDSIYSNLLDRNRNISTAIASLNIQRAADERSIAFMSYQQVAQKLESLKLKIQEESTLITVLSPPNTPIEATSPNKVLILIGFSFLFAFGFCAIFIIKYLLEISK